jgi:hypothetical protein
MVGHVAADPVALLQHAAQQRAPPLRRILRDPLPAQAVIEQTPCQRPHDRAAHPRAEQRVRACVAPPSERKHRLGQKLIARPIEVEYRRQAVKMQPQGPRCCPQTHSRGIRLPPVRTPAVCSLRLLSVHPRPSTWSAASIVTSADLGGRVSQTPTPTPAPAPAAASRSAFSAASPPTASATTPTASCAPTH